MALRLADITLKLNKSERLFSDTRDHLLNMEATFGMFREFYEEITEELNMPQASTEQTLDHLNDIKLWISNIKSTMDMDDDEPREVLTALQAIYTHGIAPGNAIRDAQLASCEKTIEDLQSLINADDKCSVCMENPRCMAFIGCGHRCVCSGCCSKLGPVNGILKCPVCRKSSGVIKVY
jgi:hypothetical protein